MKKILLLYIVFSSTVLLSQNKYNFGINYGYFLCHSDNNLPITNIQKMTNNYGLNTGCKIKLKEKLYCDINSGYFISSSKGKHNLTDFSYENDSITILYNNSRSSTLEYFLPVDINIASEADNLIYYGIGISVVGIKVMTTYKFYYDNTRTDIEDFSDNLSVLGIGLNSFIRFSYPIFNSKKYNLFTEGRFRYISKLFSICHGKDLSNYRYNFTQATLKLGLEFLI